MQLVKRNLKRKSQPTFFFFFMVIALELTLDRWMLALPCPTFQGIYLYFSMKKL